MTLNKVACCEVSCKASGFGIPIVPGYVAGIIQPAIMNACMEKAINAELQLFIPQQSSLLYANAVCKCSY